MPQISATPELHSRARRAGYDPTVLERSCVLVVGAGALGQNLALDLALTGVRGLRIVDGDVFEDHNRTRSPLHPRRGTYVPGERLPKATCVGRELRAVHVDEQSSILVADTWIEELGLGAFEGVDVIAACVDSLVARSYLARVAMLLGIPIVDGGFSGAQVGMTLYPAAGNPQRSPCWSCAGEALPGAFSCEQYARYSDTTGVVPAIQNGAAALGALCSEAIIGLLHGREPAPRRVMFDLRSGESEVFRPRPDPECSERHRRLSGTVTSGISAGATVAEALATLGDGVTLFPPDVFVERANCPESGCGATCEVGAPAHRWRRDPRCEQCGGPWPRAGEQIPSPDLIAGGLTAADPRSELTLERLGARPGDVLEVSGAAEGAVRIAGDFRELFVRLPLTSGAGDDTVLAETH
ncbi:MAG TPA: ThiF family adenylyltransferase [Solirubrobacterales bacterium]